MALQKVECRKALSVKFIFLNYYSDFSDLESSHLRDSGVNQRNNSGEGTDQDLPSRCCYSPFLADLTSSLAGRQR